ncbi:hypothetical protein ACSBR1_030452 [Camellia fascicularis]
MAAATTNFDIVDYQLPNDTHDVTFFTNQIHTLVTRSPFLVDSRISEITAIHRSLLHRLIVGLDIEWRPNNRFHDNPAATTLQLCISRRCLIFQLIYSPQIPQSLFDFLSNPIYTFVSVGIHTDVFSTSILLGKYTNFPLFQSFNKFRDEFESETEFSFTGKRSL